MQIINKLNENQKQFILYLIIGLSAATLDFVVFAGLYNLAHLDSKISTSISITCAIVFSFIFNARYNFKKSDKVVRRFVLFYLVGVVGLLISVGMIYVLSDLLGMDANLAKLISIPCLAVVQFILNKYITFSDQNVLTKIYAK